MKKIFIALFLLVISLAAFSGPVAQEGQKTFKIHSEKRMFVKKGNRHHHKHHDRQFKGHGMGGKKFMENHKK